MVKQEKSVKEYYGEENLKEIFTQILKQEFIKDYEEELFEGMKCNEKK